MTHCTLLVDIGNSRVKWAVLKGGALDVGEPFSYKGRKADALFENYWAMLTAVTQVLASNVGGPLIATEVDRWCKKRWGAESRFVQPGPKGFGVTNGYQEPLKLGVDRWVCLIGVQAMKKGAVCLVDCGTAVTIDALSEDGRHLGGMISPGLQLMKSTLLSNTSDIGEAGNGSAGLLGKCTADAVQNGAVNSISGLIERAVKELEERYKEDFFTILTGGDARQIKSHLSCNVTLEPDLALKGLSVIAQDKVK